MTKSNTVITSKERVKALRRKKAWEYKELYIMLLPAILTYIVFSYGPMYGVILAFKDYWASKGIWASPWVGFDNFRTIFGLAKFWDVFRNTFVINIYRLIFGFPAPLILALLINEVRSMKYKRIVQTVVYLPHFISWVVISGIIFALFSNDGIVNNILAELGAQKVNFLSNTKTFVPMVVISNIWKEIGWGTIVYLAAISGISPEFYEAAIVDGANRFKQVIYITIPCLVPTIVVLLIMKLGGIMSGGFDQIFNMYNEAVYDVGDIIDTYVYRIGLSEGKFSLATAVGLFLNLINMFMLVAGNVISKKISGTGLY